MPDMNSRHAFFLAAALLVLPAWPATAATPAEQLAAFGSAAGSAPSAERGLAFFTKPHGRDWSCATCHGARPVATGRHASTQRDIAPLAPAANAARFTDPAKTEKWFRRNCNDVLGRECTAGEKADVRAWLAGLKP